MTTPETPVDTVNTTYGLRCADTTHRDHGQVWTTSKGKHRLASLAKNTCAELVQSGDGGKTWQAVDSQ